MSGNADVEDLKANSSIEENFWAALKNHQSHEAREWLFGRYRKFARNIARRHFGQQFAGDAELDDLCQLAYAGLLEALDRFEPGQGVPFRGYAVLRISGSIRDGLAHMSERREQSSWRRRFRQDRTRSIVENMGQKNSTEQLAEVALDLALGFMLEDSGLMGHADLENDLPSTSAYDSLAWKDVMVQLHAELSALPPRELTVLRRHYFDGLSFEQLASLLKLSKGRISQIHHSALSQLRKRISKHD